MITIRLWGREGRCRQHLAELLARAFEREGCRVQEQRGLALEKTSLRLTLLVDGVKMPPEAARAGSEEVAIVLDPAEVDVEAVVAEALPGSLVIENAQASAPGVDRLPGAGRVTRCDASSLVACFESADGTGADDAGEAVAAAMAGAFAATTGYVRLRSVIDAVPPRPTPAGPDLRDAVLTGFTIVVASPAEAGGTPVHAGP